VASDLIAAMRRPRNNIGKAPIILITFPDYDTEHPQHGGALTAAGYTMRIAEKRGARSPEELLAFSAEAAGAIVSTDPFTRDVIRDSPHLQVIARVGVGIDSIDVGAATELGVAITTTPGANEETVADHTIAMMLGLLRRIPENDAGVRRGEWNRTGVHTPRQLAGCTVGLIGYGNIGRLVARRLAGFGVELLVSDPMIGQSDSPRSVELAELLAQSDVVSLHTPLIPATTNLIDRAALQLMQPHAVLVNTSRGGVVDEAALIRALDEGVIAGAALDVFETEPPIASPLLAMSNVVVSPHVAGISTTSLELMMRRATASVIDVIEGRIPEGLANRRILDEHPSAG
jgi:phosphoglycerate dehydrogenase-like enzyme